MSSNQLSAVVISYSRYQSGGGMTGTGIFTVAQINHNLSSISMCSFQRCWLMSRCITAVEQFVLGNRMMNFSYVCLYIKHFYTTMLKCKNILADFFVTNYADKKEYFNRILQVCTQRFF